MSKESRDEDLTGLLENLRDSIFLGIEKKLPAIVESVSADRRRVKVRPLIAIVTDAGQTLTRDAIEGVPVFQMGAGDLLISFPVEVGDIGWIEANDRDISLFLQSYAQADPGTLRKHSFSDAVFYPDLMTDFTINAEDSTAVVVQNRDGSVKIAVDQSEIRVKNQDCSWVMTDQNITADAPGNIEMTAGGNIDMTAGGSYSLTAASATITAAGGAIINGASFDAAGAIVSPVSVTAPTVAAGAGMTIAGVPVADGQHTHDAGSLQDSGGQPVTGTTAASNG